MVLKRSNLKILRIGDEEVPLLVRRNGRARRITLRLDPSGDHVCLTLPRGVAIAEGLDFARSRASWLTGQLAGVPPRIPFAPGARLPILGHEHEVRHCPGARRGVWLEDGALMVSGFPEHLERRVRDFLKAEAKRETTERAFAKARQIERPIVNLTLRDTQSRWGSCTPEGAISLSWRLVLAPLEVLDYVVAHEVAHLVHMNHGPRFWALTAKLTDQVEGPKRWLRDNGARLLRYG
ncbi:MAG: SprT family zinc-dependent metalloprotease [Pseudomonadota bacterium]